MARMTKTERVRAAIDFEAVDRIPVGLWPHFTPVDQDTDALVAAHYKFYDEMDLDFVKLMPYGLYGVEDYGVKIKKFNLPDQWAKVDEEFIKTPDDWEKIRPLDVTQGTYGKQLRYAQMMLDEMRAHRDEAPVIHTIFSPLTTLYKLVGWDALKRFMSECPARVHSALATITETTAAFVRANLDAGVSGFFFASQLANYKFMDDAAYDEFGEKYDREVFGAMDGRSWFNVVHIHSFTPEPAKSMFRRLADYPANCINWHDRWCGPTLAEARKLTHKCLIGGINEEQFLNKVEYSVLYAHVHEAVKSSGGHGFMLGPGCTIYEDTPLENYFAVRMAAEKYGWL